VAQHLHGAHWPRQGGGQQGTTKGEGESVSHSPLLNRPSDLLQRQLAGVNVAWPAMRTPLRAPLVLCGWQTLEVTLFRVRTYAQTRVLCCMVGTCEAQQVDETVAWEAGPLSTCTSTC
jgi:hypothetical protein